MKPKFKVGDKVRVHDPHWPKWDGLAIVQKIPSPSRGAYEVQMFTGKEKYQEGGFHEDHLSRVSGIDRVLDEIV